jgi:hypothetical protein
MKIGTWNVRGHYRSGSLTTSARELARYKLDLKDVQGVRWDKGDTINMVIVLFYGIGNENHNYTQLYTKNCTRS